MLISTNLYFTITIIGGNSFSHLFFQWRELSDVNLLMVIFALISILGIFGTIQAIREKAILGFVFNFAAFAVFGWFVFMTIKDQGFPPSLH